ncbi:restriction endonuclease subunit S [Pseudomonas aeruginosa]|jgi:type I restriction enzyme S subunit|nr:restriction endonuclease subunit S [Pseudomonas aeruginosa]MCW8020786.1 restriction endonuclease subunit S [Pseudomonas aeruginosa]
MVNTGDVLDGRVNLDIGFRVEKKLHDQFRRSTLRGGELLVTLVGANFGRVAIAPPEFAGYNCSRAVGVVPLTGNTEFVMFALRSPVARHFFDTWANTTAQPTFNLKDLGRLPVPIPPVESAKQISNMLMALDDRITLLRETNATLEAIAQALFKSWFVDFDPVHAKAEGRQPEGMDATTAALFPDSFEESELGLVPKGWRIGTVDDLCSQITNGGTPSRSRKDFWEGGSIPWFKTGEFCDGFLLEPSERITDEGVRGSSVKLLPKDSVLMAIYAAPTVGRLGVLTEPSAFNQACTGMVAKDSVGAWFLFLTLYFGRDWFNSRANGAAQQNISKAIVAGYSVVIPDDNVLKSFNETAESLFSRIRAGTVQAQTLTQLRDTLLPRLISGQLRLPEVQALLNDRDTAQ